MGSYSDKEYEPPVQPVSSLFFHLIIGVLLWTAFYQVARRYFHQQNAEFSSRIVAAVHGFIVTALSYLCYREGPNPLEENGQPNTLLQIRTMEISISYFIYDFGWCLYFGTEPFIMLIHHLCSITSIGVILLKEKSGAEAVMGLGTMEASNPYLQIRWFLRTAGYNNTPIHTFAEWVFILIFLTMRLVYGSQITYSILKSSVVTWDVKFCTLALFIISLSFVFYIFQFIKKKYLPRSDHKFVDDEFKKDN
ncbi:TLC domain-containing protein 5-like isoform X2 [Lycorma delicatula]|uniref:TLC domain-containing protein 5-like isoform X2 n=1 Tax=Lycorma delicatula TaxID=130591 RepID=UPI003F50FE31